MEKYYCLYLINHAKAKAAQASGQKYTLASPDSKKAEDLLMQSAALAMGVRDATGDGHIRALSDFTITLNGLLKAD